MAEVLVRTAPIWICAECDVGCWISHIPRALTELQGDQQDFITDHLLFNHAHKLFSSRNHYEIEFGFALRVELE